MAMTDDECDERLAGECIRADDRDALARLCRECECSGTGYAYRYRTDPGPSLAARSVVLYCSCPMGRWLERTHREGSPFVRRRIPDLCDYRWLDQDRYRAPPPAAAAQQKPTAGRT
jgi:hypothetical protein